jgi:hypothetical protein
MVDRRSRRASLLVRKSRWPPHAAAADRRRAPPIRPHPPRRRRRSPPGSSPTSALPSAGDTGNAQAQRFFDQGLLHCFGFNHEEAIRSFQRAAELDPKCAMAFWGAALAAGPNINNPTWTRRPRARRRTRSRALARSGRARASRRS